MASMIKDEILRSFAGKNALVTGGTGLIGRQVVDILCQAGAKVRIVSLDRLHVHDKAEHVVGDLTNFDLSRQVTEDMDFVFHLAGIKGSAGVSATKLASHFVPTMMFNTNMLEASRLNKVGKLVYTSSIGAYASAKEAMANPNLVGHAMWNSLVDLYQGCGSMDLFRQIKPDHADLMQDTSRPLQWCLFAEPIAAYRGQRVLLEAIHEPGIERNQSATHQTGRA